MDANGCRKGIIECFDGIAKLGGTLTTDLAPLKAQALTERDPRKLFLMYQTLKEILAKELGPEAKADTSFIMQTPDGTHVKVNSLAESETIALRLKKRKS